MSIGFPHWRADRRVSADQPLTAQPFLQSIVFFGQISRILRRTFLRLCQPSFIMLFWLDKAEAQVYGKGAKIKTRPRW